MKIDIVFAYSIENNSLILEHPKSSQNENSKKQLKKCFTKIKEKIILNKKNEINLKKKKIYFIKYEKDLILGIFSDELKKKIIIYNFLDEFYLEFQKIDKKKIFEKNLKIFFWIQNQITKIQNGSRRSIFDGRKSFRSISRSKSQKSITKIKSENIKKNFQKKKILKKKIK